MQYEIKHSKQYKCLEPRTLSIEEFEREIKLEEIKRKKSDLLWNNLTTNQWNELDFLYEGNVNEIIWLSRELCLTFEEALTFEFVKKIITVKHNNQIYKLKS